MKKPNPAMLSLACLLAVCVCAPAEERYHTVSLAPYTDGVYAGDIVFQPPKAFRKSPEEQISFKGIPFTVTRDDGGRWRSVKVRPRPLTEKDTKGMWCVSSAEGDRVPSMGIWGRSSAKNGDLVLHLPKGYYCKAYVLAASDGDPQKDPVLSLRSGAFQGRAYLTDTTVDVPANNAPKRPKNIKSISGGYAVGNGTPTPGRLYCIPVTIRLGELLKLIEIIGTKGHFAVSTFDVQLAQRLHTWVAAPDPHDFRVMPLGGPSGVHVFAITFETSPITIETEPASTWGVFPYGREPEYRIRITNLTDKPRKLTVTANWRWHSGGDAASQSWKFRVEPSGNAELSHRPISPKFGLHHYEVIAREAKRGDLLTRSTTFARLPEFPDAPLEKGLRSRFCTWWWDGSGVKGCRGNGAALDTLDWLGVGYVHRFRANEKIYARVKERGMQIYHDSAALCFHEDRVSVPHLMHYPKMFLGEPRYKFSAEEEALFSKEKQKKKPYIGNWHYGIEKCKRLRKQYPHHRILFGNTGFNFVEEYLHRGFPADLFDAIGHEMPGFMRMAERQPECAAFLSAYWFREALKKHGYDKPVTGCAEWMYHCTNPGNVSWQTQADYYVRDIIHALAYGFDRIAPSCVESVATTYYFNNWGACGLFTRTPDESPKLSYVSYAVAAHHLSDVDFVRAVPTGSHSAFCLEFARRRGDRLFVCWTLRGTRSLSIHGQFDSPRVIGQQGNATSLTPAKGAISFEIGPSVVFVEGVTRCESSSLGPPQYLGLPATPRTLLDSLESLNAWELEDAPDPILDDGNWSMPRQKGEYRVTAVEDDEKGLVTQFEMKALGKRPEWIPAYQALRRTGPLEIPGKPTAIGLYVKGNSGWGRAMVELVDAKGERWLSIGMPGTWNESDVESRSFINFDGWRWMEIPLPGHFGGGWHWPRYCYWRNGTSEKAGNGIVDYPLKLTRLIVEQRRKIVYVTEMVDASREPIRLSQLMAEYGHPDVIGDWEERLRSHR